MQRAEREQGILSQLELFPVPADPPVLDKKLKTYFGRIGVAKQNIKKIVQESDVICVGFSGGKDSTVLLHLVTEVLEEVNVKTKMYVLYSDTLVENPILSEANRKTLLKIEQYFQRKNINAEVKIVTPRKDETFWTYIIGKGYSTPKFYFRWCQRVLKIQPVQRFLKAISENQGVGVSLLLGHRMDESKARKKTLRYKKNHLYKYNNISTFAPLKHILEQDIWEFLMSEKPPWDESYDSVIKIYRDARGECPLIPEQNKKASGCGSRFGCWVCSLVSEDKSLKNMAKIDESVKPYIEFRNWLIEYCNRTESRLSYSRTGRKVNKGALSFRTRRKIFEELRKLEEKTGKKIMSDVEQRLILEQWEKDKELFEKFEKGGAELWQPAT